MAQLTWRDVAAPDMDLRGLSQAGNTISNAFDRFGQMLIDKGNQQKKEVTDGAVANMLMTGSPEELEALRAKGLAGLDPRVDKVAIATAMGNRMQQLLDQGLTKEKLAEAQDPVKNGQKYAQLEDAQRRLTGGDASAQADVDRLTSELEGARFITEHIRGGFEMGDKDRGFGQTQLRDDRAYTIDQGQLGVARANAATNAAEASARIRLANLQYQDAVREHTDAAATRNGEAFGNRYLDNLTKRNPAAAGSAAQLLVTLPEYKALSPAGKKGALAGITARSAELFQDTPWNMATDDARTVGARVALTNSNAAVADSLIQDQLTRSNPGLAILNAAQKPEYQNAKIDDVKARWAKSGIRNSDDYVDDLIRRHVSLPEIMALPDVIDTSDRNFDITKLPSSLFGGAFTKDGYGSNILGMDFTSGTNRVEAGLTDLEKMRKPGGLAAAQQKLEGRQAPIAAVRNEMAMLEQVAKAERQANNGRVSAATQNRINAKAQEMQELLGTVRGPADEESSTLMGKLLERVRGK